MVRKFSYRGKFTQGSAIVCVGPSRSMLTSSVGCLDCTLARLLRPSSQDEAESVLDFRVGLGRFGFVGVRGDR